jgi:hypothetical protein
VKSRRSPLVVVGVLVSMAAAGGLYVLASRSVVKDPAPIDAQSTAIEQRTAQKVLSRGVMELAIRYSREAQLAPTEAARQHAYVASAYANALEKNLGQKEALYAAQEMLRQFHPAKDLGADINRVASEYVLSQKSPQEEANPETTAIVAALAKRSAADRHDIQWDGVMPAGEGTWTGTNPLTPRAGEWQRWGVSGVIVLPRPTKFDSEEFNKELEEVRAATEQLSDEVKGEISAWSGSGGADLPDAAWQDRLYETIKTDLPADKLEADALYAAIQKQVSLVLVDSILECWRVKYTYWTARPSMIDAQIKPAVQIPNYPAYPSVHSSVSSAAAQVLSVLVPAHRGEWFEMAEKTGTVQLSAGHYLPSDISAGAKLGELIGQQFVQTLELKAVL